MLAELLIGVVKQGFDGFMANWCFPLVRIHLISGHCCLPYDSMPLVDLNKEICLVGLKSRYFNQTYIE